LDAIAKSVENMSIQDQVLVLREMKAFVERNPSGAKQMLQENPALSFALLRMQVTVGVLAVSELQSFLNGNVCVCCVLLLLLLL